VTLEITGASSCCWIFGIRHRDALGGLEIFQSLESEATNAAASSS